MPQAHLAAPSAPRLRALLALLLFAATLALAGHSVAHRRQLGFLGGLSDRWLELGLHLLERGTFGLDGQPTVFKAPGYAFFEAAVLRLANARLERRERPEPTSPFSDLAWLTLPYDAGDLEQAARCVYLAQALLLAATATALFLWLSSRLRTEFAFTAGALFGLNPYSIVLVGLLHYSILTLFLTVLGAWLFDAALRTPGESRGRLLLAGVVWGLGALVRSVTLATVPLLLLLTLRGAPSRRHGWLRALAFLFGLGAAVAPWTARNWLVSGRPVAINLQFWSTFYGATARPAPAQPDSFRWKLVRAELMAVQARLAGPRESGWEPYTIPENARLEELFREQSLLNLRAQPGVYLYNVRESLRTFNLDLNVALVRVFQHVQQPGRRWQAWFNPGALLRSQPREEARLLKRAAWVLTALAGLGLLLALARRDGALLVPSSIYASLCAVHALVWMDFMYYSVKLPWLLALALFALDRLALAAEARTRLARPLAGLLLAALLGFVLELSWRVLG